MAHLNPFVAAFSSQVDRLLDQNDPDSFWACGPAFRELLNSNVAVELLNAELRQIASNPQYVGDWRQKQLMVVRGNGYGLSISTLDEPRRYIHTTPFNGMFVPLGTESLRYSRYRLPKNYRNDVFDPSLKLERAGSGAAGRGEVLEIRSKEYAFDFDISVPVIVLKFVSASHDALEWLFSRESLAPWQATDAEIAATQLRVASYVLGRLAHQSSLDILEELASHRHHAVRWAAIQSLGRISRTAAVKKLERALSDPHPHVRGAAEKTLTQLNGKMPAKV